MHGWLRSGPSLQTVETMSASLTQLLCLYCHSLENEMLHVKYNLMIDLHK